MKKYWWVLILLVLAGIPAFTQTRSDIQIHILPVKASPDRMADADYFQENFAVETIGAGYALTDEESEADYTLQLEVKPNMVVRDDGTTDLAPPDQRQYALNILLIRNEDEAEVVAFSFPYDNVDEMNDFNLYLLYEAIANVPFTKLGDIPIIYTDDWWRNKWVYFRMSVDAKSYRLDNIIPPWLAATAGIEIQYLNWMSTEFSFNLSFINLMSNAFIATAQIEQKFPIKPSAGAKNFMIEPYGVVAFPTNMSSNSKTFPGLGVGGGIQLGTKGGSMGAFFIDVNFIYYLDDVAVENSNSTYKSRNINYYRYALGLGIGYKIGFINRPEIKRRGEQQ